MLTKFRFENFLSFKNSVTLNCEASSIRELPENTFSFYKINSDLKVLKSLAFFGANSSGKSNILKAFGFMRNFTLNSVGEGKVYQSIQLEPYRLDASSESKPSLFEVSIIIEAARYKYGFTLTKNEVIEEWLTITEKRKEEYLFVRKGQEFAIEKKFRSEAEGNAQMLSKITKENALFLTTLGQFKSMTAKKVLEWFIKSMVIFDGTNQDVLNFTAELLKEPYYKRRITDILSKTDLGFSSVETELLEISNRSGYDLNFVAALYSNDIKNNYKMFTSHEKYKERKFAGHIRFDLQTNESLGSQKFVLLLGPILKALREGAVLWIDELDARIHTNLLLSILRFFHSPQNNPLGSQIIYSCHNQTILKKDLRRDQMIFIKRDNIDGSLLTSLHDWDSKIRSDASFDKDYLDGKYGAIPKIDLTPDLFD